MTFSENSEYGQLVKSTWQRDNDQHELGFTLFLGQRNAMPRDLGIKLDMMLPSSRLVETFIILWPRSTNFAGEAFEQLTGTTRKKWDEHQAKTDCNRVRLCAIEPSDIATFLALEHWYLEMYEEHISEDQLRQFVSEQTAFLKTFIHLPS